MSKEKSGTLLRVVTEKDKFEGCVLSIFDDNKELYHVLGEPDACVHMAWRNGFVHNADTHMGDLSAHFMFVKNMIDAGLKNIAVMGTMHEVGYWEGAIDEKTPCNPLVLLKMR